MTKKEDKQPKAEQPQPEANIDALAKLVTLFTIYQLREHRGEKDE